MTGAEILAVAVLVVAPPPEAGTLGRSPLALAKVAGDDAPELLLAQRAIERSWGLSEDSVYREIDVPGWKSEGLAMGLSAVVPGLGQAYAEERGRALLFAAAEVAGWVAHVLYRNRGEELREDAARFAGDPEQSWSPWSFERWAATTQSDPAELRLLYAADREAFYDLIGSDPRYLVGWSGDPSATRRTFEDLRRHASDRQTTSRWYAAGLWLNHVVAAVDAVRAARLHDVPLRPNVDLRLNGSWRDGRPGLLVSLERRF